MKASSQLINAFGLSFSFLLACPLSSFAQATFQGLGDLPGGEFRSFADGISSDGSVVVGDGESASGPEAFRWTRAGGMVGLGDLSGGIFESNANAVSSDGSVIVGFSESASGREAFRWTEADGMVGLGDLPGGTFSSAAAGVSPDGLIVVGFSASTKNGLEAFRWSSAGGMEGLGDLSGGRIESRACAVSNNSVVVGRSDTGRFAAFRWTDTSGMVALRNLAGGGDPFDAQNISSDGSFIVGRSVTSSGYEAYRWSERGGFEQLGDLPGGEVWSTAKAVSDDGSVVVGRGSSASGSEAFIWDPVSGMRNLRAVLVDEHEFDLTGWTLKWSEDISSDGQTIVGWGTNPEGSFEGWIATIPRQETGPRLDVDYVDGEVTLSWPAGHFDRLQFSGDLATWLDVPEVDAMTATSFTVPIAAREKNAYYRLMKDQ